MLFRSIIILIDQITKVTITRLFSYGESLPVTSFFDLVLAHNKGAAFSFLAAEGGWQRYFFTGIDIAAAIFIMDLLKIALLLSARHASLLGLDRKPDGQGKSGRDQYAWVTDPNTTEQRLLEEARRQGIRIPTRYDVKQLEAKK